MTARSDFCASCAHLHEQRDEQIVGQVNYLCLEGPPSPIFTPMQGGGLALAGYANPPITSPETQFCGRHKPQPVALQS